MSYRYYFTCEYCDHKWNRVYYVQPDEDTKVECPTCKDKNVHIRHERTIDYYQDTKK